ncbi:malonyl-ACP O-methyltransferase BioC [Pantoea sp. 1.19]|uniref:malonyl-ACP O-methyltransferase BioC n=1 Tax=Pantoea sp. 1.19 TaxID=1925589 RepID=UPI000AB16592|nr:malonyl-ACP O-methyltransferase BioC [Pantoea sp. 1.19]
MTQVNKAAVAQAFGRAAESYQQHAQMQRQCGDRLLALGGTLPAGELLDAGCGTGWFSQRWRAQGMTVTALDLSPGMLQRARQGGVADRYLLGDIEALPLADNSVDAVWSNLAVQWCSSLSLALAELCRVTRPGGRVLFSTLEAGSLSEVREAWLALDAAPPVNRFLPEAAIRAASAARLHGEPLRLWFDTPLAALHSLKGIGATHLHSGQARPRLDKARLQRLAAAWPRDAQGYRLSYQIVYGVIDVE